LAVGPGSADYRAAVIETKVLFPDGLCCEPNPDLTAAQVPTELEIVRCCLSANVACLLHRGIRSI